MNSTCISKYITVSLGGVTGNLFLMKVKDVLPIYYVAVRGRDDVPGAVQRVLNKRRINAIKEFILDGNMFFNTFILNWTDDKHEIHIDSNGIRIPAVAAGAQVIDGQHRLEGLRQACEVDPAIGEQSIIVVLTKGLSTAEAANIFLNINTEQKPVPSSLIYDLFGEVNNNSDRNYHISRATDLVTRLNDDADSPYYRCVRMPGSASGVGKVDLSTFVNALKQFTKRQGVFDEYNLSDMESQYKVIFNFFATIRKFYDEEESKWLKSTNPFMANAGCHAGVEFLCQEIIPKCAANKSFEQSTMERMLPLNQVGLVYKEDLKNKQGKEQRSIVYQQLKAALLVDIPDRNEYKF